MSAFRMMSLAFVAFACFSLMPLGVSAAQKPRLVVMTVVVATLLGVIAGLGPAWRAARLSPVLSLVEGPLWEN